MKRPSWPVVALAVAGVLAGSAQNVAGYSVLSHEATIDAVWDSAIGPLLLKRFPDASQEDLNRAHSFAYGGSVIQDLGYYPFGNRMFSNLLHYVRSGDFVEALLHAARDIDEYAFALGALAHYTGDSVGHPEATNRAVPIIFPKVRQKFGDDVAYAQAPQQHIRTEFSFDVVQTAGGAYLPEAYKTFIGFRVATDPLERAFRETYGLEMKDLFGDLDRSVATYRYAVSQLIPALTEAAWRDKQDEIAQRMPNMSRAGFVFLYQRADFEREFGTDYRRPGRLARFLTALYRILPKIGPLKTLAFKAPTADVQAMFVASFTDASNRYSDAVAEVAGGRFDLPNTNFDTGHPTRHGDYSLADETYAELLETLGERSFRDMPPGLRQDVLSFYGDHPAPASRKERKHWKDVQQALVMLAGPS